MNLVTRHERCEFIKNDLGRLLHSNFYIKGIEFCIQDDYIWEMRTPYIYEIGMVPVATKVLNIREIKNIEYTLDHLFITREDGTIIHICNEGAYDADKSFYNTVVASGINSVL